MKYLFGREGRKALARLSGGDVLLAFDFDGTLAPITRDPTRAAPSAATVRGMRRMVKSHPVAVISGRAIRDLKKLLHFKPMFLVGNHGLEAPGVEGAKERARRITAQWATAFNEHFQIPRVALENKRYSLSVHYREARVRAAARAKILSFARGLNPPPRAILGKLVVNLVPPGSPNKGTALFDLMKLKGAQSAFFIGDDVTDEDVFRLRSKNILSVRVGKSVQSAAPFFIRNQREIERVVEFLNSERALTIHKKGRSQVDRG